MSKEKYGGMKLTEKAPDSSTRALWKSYQQSSGSKQEERTNGMRNMALRITVFLFILTGYFLHVVNVKFYISPPTLLPLRRKSCYGFLSLLKIHHLCRV
jgi:hypothetical protein